MTKEGHPTLSGAQDQDGWFTSSFSSNANQCVEVRLDSESVSIRDSKYRHNPANHPAQEPIITITTDHWTALLHHLTASRSRQTEQSAGAAKVVDEILTQWFLRQLTSPSA